MSRNHLRCAEFGTRFGTCPFGTPRDTSLGFEPNRWGFAGENRAKNSAFGFTMIGARRAMCPVEPETTAPGVHPSGFDDVTGCLLTRWSVPARFRGWRGPW